MTLTSDLRVAFKNPDRFYIGGEWVAPSSSSVHTVLDSHSEEPFLTVAEAQAPDMDRAVTAARQAFDHGPWPRMSHQERAGYLRRIADALDARMDDFNQIWPRESGVVHSTAQYLAHYGSDMFKLYADLADTYPFEEVVTPTPTALPGGDFGLLCREPVGVVGAIVAWNGPLQLLVNKTAPSLLAGCTLVLKLSPEAPAAGYLFAEIVEAVGLPAGVVNVVTADREVSELLVTDPRVDKISFTGSTAAGRRIGAIMGGRIGRCTLELGGKSAAVILDDADLGTAAMMLAGAECLISGQACASLTRIVVPRSHHDEFAEALGAAFSAVTVGDPFDPTTQMGPLAMARHRDRVAGYIASGVQEGATLITGGGRPKHLDRGYYIEPTVFANVDNRQTIAQEEIFGPVLSVIPADDEEHAIAIANDTIYGLNAAVFTADAGRAREVGRRLRSGTVGQNNFRIDFGIAFGGFKQSGIGREGGREGLLPYLETKTMLLDGPPPGYSAL
jgi:acyl-CoA reductase-like NAD-dependent aldehyde dehydrogenase